MWYIYFRNCKLKEIKNFLDDILEQLGIISSNIKNNNEINIIEKQHNEEKKMGINIPLNQILYGPPGTGKTFSIRKYIDAILGKNPGLNIENEDQCINNIVKNFNRWR